MGDQEVDRSRAPTRSSVPVLLLGLVILLLGAVHVLVDDDPVAPEVAESLILIAFAVAVFWVGYRISTDGMGADESVRIALVALGGGLAVGLLSGTYLLSRIASGEPVTEGEYVLSIGWSIGVAAGALVAYYLRRVERGRERQADLASRLTILQRVLRHNLRNELAVIGGATRDARALVDDPTASDKLDVAERHVQKVLRLSEMSGRLTRVWQMADRREVDLDALVEDELDRFEREYPDVPVSFERSGGVTVLAHPEVRLAVREALLNAALHNDPVEVTVVVRGPGPGDAYASIEVRDTGSGIPETELEPLRAGVERPLAHTTGLGLWLIYWLVESSGGELDLESGSRGSTVAMRLPAV